MSEKDKYETKMQLAPETMATGGCISRAGNPGAGVKIKIYSSLLYELPVVWGIVFLQPVRFLTAEHFRNMFISLKYFGYIIMSQVCMWYNCTAVKKHG